MRQFFLRLLYCIAAIFLLVTPVSAAPVDEGQWEVPLVGIMKGVDGFSAIDLETWVQELEPALAAEEKKTGNMPPLDALKLQKIQLPKEIKMYQLQVDKGNAYHLAWAIFFKDKENERNKGKITRYFTTEQEKFINEMNGMLHLGVQTMETESKKTDFGKIKVLNLMPLSKLEGSSEVIYTMSGRMIVDMKGLILPAYGKAFFLQRDDQLVSAIILTQDSDGEFWEKAADQLFTSLIP